MSALAWPVAVAGAEHGECQEVVVVGRGSDVAWWNKGEVALLCCEGARHAGERVPVALSPNR
eukprot:6083945-Amphidinium_carterae.1